MHLQEVPDLWIETDEVDEEVTVEPDEDDETPSRRRKPRLSRRKRCTSRRLSS